MNAKILVLGIGNLLMGDEGIGIHVIKEFEKINPYKNFVDVIDGGTGGFNLLSYFNEYEKIIIVDAAIGDKPAGTLDIIKPKFSSDFPKTLTAHDIGLKDLIDTATLLGKLPDFRLILIYIDKFQTLNLDLSQVARSAINPAINLIINTINEFI